MISIITIGLFLAIVEMIIVCIILPVGIALLIALAPPALMMIVALFLINWLYGKGGKNK